MESMQLLANYVVMYSTAQFTLYKPVWVCTCTVGSINVDIP